MNDFKVCSKCKLEKPKSEYWNRYAQCKTCGQKVHDEWNRKNRTPEYRRKNKLKSYYGITIEQFNDMFTQQQGKCLICLRHQSELERKLRIDHNHVTKVIRGLLCDQCNTAI